MRPNDVEPFILWVSRASDGRRVSLPIDYHDVALPEPISGDRNINLAALRPEKNFGNPPRTREGNWISLSKSVSFWQSAPERS